MIAGRIKTRLQGGLGSFFGEAIRDLIFLAGGAAIVWGTHFLSVPAAWILGGALVMFFAYSTAPDEGAMNSEAASAEQAIEASKSILPPSTRRAA